MQCFTVSVYGSSRPRAVGPGLTIFFDISYLVITQSWTRNEPWLAYFFQQLLCYFALEKKAIQKINYRLKKRKKKSSLRLLETDRTRTKKKCYRDNFKNFPILIRLNILSPKSDQHQFSPNNIYVSSREYDMRMNTENGHLVTRGKILSTDLFNWSQILSTDSLMECMEVIQKNLLVDTGAKGVRVKWYTSDWSRGSL